MLRSSRGFSIIEVVIAMALVALLAYSTMTFFPTLKSVEVGIRSSNSCRAYIDAAFGAIEKYGIQGQTQTLPVPGLNVTFNSNPNWANLGLPNSASPDLTNTQLYPLASQSLIGFTDSNHLTTFRTAGMILGSMSIVNALYNNNAAICTSGINYAGSSLTSNSTFPAPPNDMYNRTSPFNLLVQIQPYNWRTHSTVACGTSGFTQGSFIPAPRGAAANGIQSGTGTYTTGGYNTYFPLTGTVPDIRNDLAFLVTLSATHNENGKSQTCSEQKVFGYLARLTAPPLPDSLTFKETMGAPRTTWGPDRIDVTIGYSAVAATAGTIILCQDASTSLGLQTPSTNAYYNPNLISGVKSAWVPCEAVTACGKKQDSGTYYTNASVYPNYTYVTDNTHFTLHMRWTNSGTTAANTNRGLAYNCGLKINVKAVDPVGNISSSTASVSGNIVYVGP